MHHNATGTIAAGETAAVTMNNEFYTGKTISVQGKKVFEGDTINENQFSFTISSDDANAPLPSPATVYAGANGIFVFGNMTFALNHLQTNGEYSTSKTYAYKVKENLPGGVTATSEDTAAGYKIVNGIKYDLTEKSFSVTVTYDSSTGEMQVNGGNYTIILPETDNFVNEKTGALKITKTVKVNGENVAAASSDAALTNGTYTFNINGVTGTATEGVGKTVEITFDGGVATAYKIGGEETAVTSGTNPYTVEVTNLIPGAYTIAETAPTNGTTLTAASRGDGDPAAVDENNVVTVTVTSGQTGAQVAAAGTASFTNNKPYVTQTPEVTKKLNGADFTGSNGAGEAASFTFTLKHVTVGGTDGNTAYTVDSGAALQTVTTAADGSISFDAIEFTQPGDFIFQIAETGTDSDTMDYADPIYVKIEVTESNGDGVLTAGEPAYYSDIECTQRLTNATFDNTELTQISAKKTWSGSGEADDWPTGMSVTFKIKQYKGETEQSEFTTTAAANGNDTSVTIAGQETVNWTRLPRYYPDSNDAVQEYRYEVIETAVLFNNTAVTDYKTVYTVSGEGAGINGLVTIDNTPVTISIKVTKEWTRSNGPVTNRESISYALYKTYAQTSVPVTVAADQLAADPDTAEVGKIKYAPRGWQTVTISNLPKYERVVATEGETTSVSYNPISYYVVETDAAADPGYVLTAAYRADNDAETTAEGAAISTNEAKITIINTETAGAILPSTGGSGILPYALTGLALLLGAALFLLLRRKKETT